MSGWKTNSHFLFITVVNINNFVMMVVILMGTEYNKSVIIIHKNSNKSVKECIYGTIDFEETAGMEELTLS